MSFFSEDPFSDFRGNFRNWRAAAGMLERIFCPAFEFGDLFRRQILVKFVAEVFKNLALFLERKFFDLFQNLGRTHASNLHLGWAGASGLSGPTPHA